LNVLGRSERARYIAGCLLGALFGGADVGDISLLEFVELIGREGGAYRFVIGEVGHASHIVEGTSALCNYLRAKIVGQVNLSASAPPSSMTTPVWQCASTTVA
jgi:monoamine oxidase